MNLHNVVRPLVTTVNPDIPALWRQSNGFTKGADGRPVPQYIDHTGITIQPQAWNGETLKHPDSISQQGVRRDVYMYGDVQGINRPDSMGGDLLQFAETPGGPIRVFLIVCVFETWPDWCKVGVVLQTDAAV